MIEARGLSKRYGSHQVFRHLDLDWPNPGVICVAGPNGSGKSTLLSLLSGASAPDQGDILLLGKSLAHAREAALRLVSYVPDVCPIYPFISGREWLELTRSLRPGNPATGRELLSRFDLLSVLEVSFGSMSLGTAKKFMLTAALMCETPVVIMDEPTNGLDQKSFGVLREHLAERKAKGLVVLSCHDPAQREQLGATTVDLRSLVAA